MVSAGEAIVVTQFGAVTRVITEPGLAWKAPAPIQLATPVDLRLRTTSTGLQDVGTRDGLRILVQAYAAWSVPKDEKAILQYLRAVRNDPDEAARQLRSFVGSALQVTASDFDLADLVNADPSRLRLSEFEARLRQQVEAQVRATYGIAIAEIGVERLTLPETTLNATVARMRSERETIAVQRTAEGQRRAAEIRADAQRDSRVAIAAANGEGGRHRSGGAARGGGHLRQGLSERSAALSFAALARHAGASHRAQHAHSAARRRSAVRPLGAGSAAR